MTLWCGVRNLASPEAGCTARRACSEFSPLSKHGHWRLEKCERRMAAHVFISGLSTRSFSQLVPGSSVMNWNEEKLRTIRKHEATNTEFNSYLRGEGAWAEASMEGTKNCFPFDRLVWFPSPGSHCRAARNSLLELSQRTSLFTTGFCEWQRRTGFYKSSEKRHDIFFFVI